MRENVDYKTDSNYQKLSDEDKIKVGDLRKSNSNWLEIAKITCCKN